MNICILTNNSGGLYDFRAMLMLELVKKGNRLTAVTPYDTNVEDIQRLGVETVNVPMNRRGMNPVEDLRLMAAYRRELLRLKPDLVITYTIKPNIYGGMMCRMLMIPYAANITGLGTAFQGSGILKKFVVSLYGAGLKKAKAVFFENSENLNVFTENGIVRPEQTCLLNGAGVDLDYFTTQPYPAGDVTRFLFIGRVMKEKGIDELFSAMKMLISAGEKCTLDILGGCEEDYEEQIKAYEDEGWLKYHGYQLDVRPFINTAHCFVLPSWHEGMANTNLECAASGRPVITSNIHGCLEAVEDGVTGLLCEKKDADSLYAAMKQFCAYPYEKRRTMGAAGRGRMESIFDKRQVVKNTIDRLFE